MKRKNLYRGIGIVVMVTFVGLMLAHTTAATASASPVPSVSVTWGDSTALVQWSAAQGATGYRVSLVRVSDNGIMEQFDVPASQLAADAQGIWPNEQYFVAVQPLDAQGNAGPATLSSPGQPVPISRATYNGFLDTMGLPAGSLDSNLWDIRGYVPDGVNPSSSDTFINGQIHGHLETGQISIEQSLVGMTARVPVDFTNRTAHIHGEVDLHGNVATWFTVNLTPVPIAPTQIVDVNDREFNARSLPILTLFDGKPGPNADLSDLRLFEAIGNGQAPVQVGSVMAVPDFSYNNVRNTLDYYVSTTHVKVVVDGQTLADMDLPEALPFSVASLNLSAESYPKQDVDTYGHVLPCDQVGGECNIWHLDNWGFDAPPQASGTSAVQPATLVDYSAGCTPAPSQPEVLVPDVSCDEQTVNPGQTATYHLNVAGSNLQATTGVQVLTQSYGFDAPGMQVSVNGGAWLPMRFLDTAQTYGELGSADIPVSQLQAGNNTVRFRSTPNDGGTQIANTVLQQTLSTPFVPPALPPEAAPIGTWGGGQPTPTPTTTNTPTPTATNTPTPTPINIQNVPCTVQLPSGTQTGTCTGTFTPGS